MSKVSGWPALDDRTSATGLRVERGVYGKVHGAISDYRWIATSGNFDAAGRRLHEQLLAGSEDAPRACVFWRAFPADGAYGAVSAYNSRARDAASRSGFLEKQVLWWRAPPSLPAVAGALALMPKVAGLRDDVWWDEWNNSRWSDRDFNLSIAGLSLEADQDSSQASHAASTLCQAVEPRVLGRLYADFLDGQRPALLRCEQPLMPEAVAALLLPLPRAVADLVSVAGWVPSRTAKLEQLRGRWDIVACSHDLFRSERQTAASGQHWEFGRVLAEAILRQEPARIDESIQRALLASFHSTAAGVLADPSSDRGLRAKALCSSLAAPIDAIDRRVGLAREWLVTELRSYGALRRPRAPQDLCSAVRQLVASDPAALPALVRVGAAPELVSGLPDTIHPAVGLLSRFALSQQRSLSEAELDQVSTLRDASDAARQLARDTILAAKERVRDLVSTPSVGIASAEAYRKARADHLSQKIVVLDSAGQRAQLS